MNATQPEQGSQPNQSTTSINNSSMNITIANGISNIAIDKYLRIATHNVQGLTCNIKFQIFLEHCIKSELHIIAMTETKLKNQNTIALSNPLYKIYTSNHIPTKSAPQEASLGTAIAVLPQLQPYIHNIQTCLGTAICIDFFFPANTKLRIISTYLPSNHLSLKSSTHKQISNWVLEVEYYSSGRFQRRFKQSSKTQLNTSHTQLLISQQLTKLSLSDNTDLVTRYIP